MGYGSPEPRAVEDVFRAIAEMDEGPEDGLQFDLSSVTAAPIRDQAEYDGIRVRLIAHLGSARIPLQVDIGFGDAITPDPEPAAEGDELYEHFRAHIHRGVALVYKRVKKLPDMIHLMPELPEAGEDGAQQAT